MFIFLNIMSSIIGLTGNIITQISVFKLFPKLGLLKSVVIGFAAGLVCLLAIEYLLYIYSPSAFESAVSANLLAYIALGYCYFHFISLGETARRIRILWEIYDSKDGLTEEDILSRYNAEEILALRINRLLSNGQVKRDGNTFLIGNPFVLWISKLIIAMKLLITGKKSEFD